MIYLDYSATTPLNKEVLDTYNKVSLEYIGNPNSLHALGVKSRELMNSATKQIASLLNVLEEEIIYTSGASESNNMAIKGIALKYQNRGKHIITTNLEHASIFGPLNYLQDLGFEIDFVNIQDDGLVDLEHLKSLIRAETILVSICAVDSELGIRQNVEDIALYLKANHPKIFFHVDATQAIGKTKIDFTNIDLASISAHKFYGPKGIGLLIKKKNVSLVPLIHGGKSTTAFRSGTPALPLMVALAKALRLVLEQKYDLTVLSKMIVDKLRDYPNILINSTVNSIPHTINFSLIDVKPESFIHALEAKEVYISTKSACSNADSISKAVYAVTKNESAAFATLRVSLSYLTTKDEVERFLAIFDECYQRMVLK